MMKNQRLPDYRQETLLVVTDDKLLKSDLEKLFVHSRYEIVFFNNYPQLQKALLNRPIVVCIFDFDSVREESFRDLPSDIPFLTIVADIELYDPPRIYYRFEKPINYEELFFTVRSAFKFHCHRVIAGV